MRGRRVLAHRWVMPDNLLRKRPWFGIRVHAPMERQLSIELWGKL